MIIDKVHIRNFRCIEDAEIEFERVTSFIGPNGAGKSTVLRALDWVFNCTKDSLSYYDILGGGESNERTISVTVTFKDLTTGDRDVLTDRYAPVGAKTFAVRREWGMHTPDKLSGSTLAYGPFAPVRALADGPIGPLKPAYDALVDSLKDSESPLQDAPSKPKIIESLRVWEAAHTELLTQEFVTDTHMFGIAGQGELAKVFKYVFVDADLRASDETEDANKTVINKVLAHALDRSAADQALKELANEVTKQHDAINREHLGPALSEISQKLSDGVKRFTTGRTVSLAPRGSDYTPPKSRVEVSIWDSAVETKMTSQGHGFQRAVLVSSLQILAEYANSSDQSATLCLAIEEPELFQHPNQARAFASVLRDIASRKDASAQVAYATHSPHFVDPVKFQEVRRVTKSDSGEFTVASTSREAIATAVAPQQRENWDINSTWSNVILKDLREALFASAVVLCEGPDDAAVLMGASRHTTDFNVHGISVAAVGGKTDLFLAHAVLSAFGIPVLTVFDNDSGMDGRAEAKKKRRNADGKDLTSEELADIQTNKKHNAEGANLKLCLYLAVPDPQAYPIGELSPHAYAVDDTLETVLESGWPEMLLTKDQVIASGSGSPNVKHVATYQLAAETCPTAPRGQIAEIVALALRLA